VAENNTPPNEYDVLIIGAGPSGLALGLQLARYGVKFQIIDKRSTFNSDSHAFAIQGSTLEILNDLGVAEGIMQLGLQVKKVNAFIKEAPSFDIDFKQEIPSPFSYLVTLEQSKIEKLLAGGLQLKGHHVSWNAELLSFKQSKTGVTAEIQQDGKKVTTTASWIVGCDGVHSSVRQILGIHLQGNSYSERFIMADLAIQWALPKDQAYAFLHPSDLFLVFPLPNDLYRVMTTQDNIPHKGDITMEHLVSKFKKLCPVEGSITSPKWLSGYEVQRGFAQRMRKSRAFLVGDAAHIQSPVGGQGLNSGIQDAYNLGWKLGLHIKGLVKDQYLDSYESERLNIAKSIHTNTNLAMNIVMTHSKLGQLLRDMIAPLILNYPAAQKQLKRIIADSPVSYRQSHIMFNEKMPGQGLARKLKESFTGGVNIGSHAPSVDLLEPKGFKRFQLLKLMEGPKHTILVMLGENSKEFPEQYANFSLIKKEFEEFAQSYFIVGEHAIDYTCFDLNLTDAFIDPDGQGHQLYNCIETTLYLIRPDGFISYKGLPNAAVLWAFVEEHFQCKRHINPTLIAGRSGF
jgi:2-polyprenyl-6-methoxyphenol hydroxylase-like FAD-dependent oxidoreductase